MIEDGNLLGTSYKGLYSGYYTGSEGTAIKRQISGAQSVQYMKRAFGDKTFGTLLDVGAGDGNVLSQLDGVGLATDLYAVEISESGIAAINARLLPGVRDARVFDGYRIPYPDKFFDLAVAIHVLEHVEHERLFLREMARVARQVYIEVPLEHGLRIQRAIDSGRRFGHINFYTQETLRSLLESTAMEVRSSGAVPSSLAYEQHLSGKYKGRLKSLIRRSALALAPKLSPRFIVYNGYAYCECK